MSHLQIATPKTLTPAQMTNDAIRQNPALWVFTSNVRALPGDKIEQIIKLVKEFNDFNEDNDPWQEHDFGSFDFEGTKYFWKIEAGSLCIMEADEY
jgi:hypothetical protein